MLSVVSLAVVLVAGGKWAEPLRPLPPTLLMLRELVRFRVRLPLLLMPAGTRKRAVMQCSWMVMITATLESA
jgi:hypothetical protein